MRLQQCRELTSYLLDRKQIFPLHALISDVSQALGLPHCSGSHEPDDIVIESFEVPHLGNTDSKFLRHRFDLGNNIGHPILDGSMHENLHAAIAKVLAAANAAGKKAGIFCTSGEQAKGYADQGFHMMSVATDMHILPTGVMQALSTAKGLGHASKLTGPYGK